MGQQQSTSVKNSIYNNLNTRKTTEMLSMLANSTNSVSRNTQNISLDIAADTVGDINLFQTIESVININNIIDSVSNVNLSESLKSVIKDDVSESIRTQTDGLAIFARPENRQLLNDFINNVNTLIDQSITSDNVSEVMIQNDALQDAILKIDAKNLGNVNINQSIHAKQIAENVMENIFDIIYTSGLVTDLESNLEIESVIKEESPLTSGLNMLWLIASIVIAVILLIMAFLFSGIGIRLTLVIFAVIIVIVGVLMSRSKSS